MLQPTVKSVSSVYDRFARLYDVIYGRVLQNGRQVLSRVLNAEPGQQVLEVGVGSGLMLSLYPSCVTVVGLDLSPEMLDRARLRVKKLGLKNIDLRLVDAEHNGLVDETFDHVVLPYVYSVTPNPRALIREAFRVCRVGGNIWILNHFSGIGPWDWIGRPIKPFAQWVGFRSDFSFQTYVTDLDMDIQGVYRVNLYGLSRLVHIRRSRTIPQIVMAPGTQQN